MLIGLIGGRVVPSFTRNWLSQRGAGILPAPMGRLDHAAMAALVVAILSWIAAPASGLTGGLLVIAGVGLLARLARWRGASTLAQPLVLILHLGYGWLGAGLALLGLAILWPAVVGTPAAMHALTAGAIGTMTLAIMTRATLGHTGRALAADGATVWIYGLVQAGRAASRARAGPADRLRPRAGHRGVALGAARSSSSPFTTARCWCGQGLR